jgi:hypothetical protein
MPQSKGDVVQNAQVSEKIEGLKDKSDLSPDQVLIHTRRGDFFTVQENLTIGKIFNLIHAAKQGGFSRTR